jgi:GDP-L-fucose synthase
MEGNAKIYVAGHRGMVGSAIIRLLKKSGYKNLIFKTSKELDLTNQNAVTAFFNEEKPEYVFMAAAKVGGIMANNIIHSSFENKVQKMLFLGSSCIYPKMAPQPLKEEYLLTGPLEYTNEPYAIAKIAGIKMCESYNKQYGTNYISVMPTNLYGPNDNYDLNTSHVLPALIRKFHEARTENKPVVEIWGTGSPRREFLHADDLAEACLYLMQNYSGSDPVNIGSGEDVTIKDLAVLIKNITGYQGELKFDVSKPDGTPRKLMDVSKLAGLGWKYKIGLEEGIKNTYEQYKQTLELAI